MIPPVRLRLGIGCAGLPPVELIIVLCVSISGCVGLLPIELIIVLCECISGCAGTAEAPSGVCVCTLGHLAPL